MRYAIIEGTNTNPNAPMTPIEAVASASPAATSKSNTK
jgi:hypothetical protein